MSGQKNLYRSCKNRMLGGVCGGLGEYFNIDPVLIRIALVIFALAYGVGVLFYLIAWIIIPEDPNCRTNKKDNDEKTEEIASDVKKEKKEMAKEEDRSRIVLGLILLVAGAIFLLQNLFRINLWQNFWPAVIIVIGLGIILSSIRKGDK